MSLEDLIELVKLILSGKSDLGTLLATPVALLVVFVLTLLGIVPSLVKSERHGWAALSFLLAGGLAGTFFLATGGRGVRPEAHADVPSFELHAGHVLIGGDLSGRRHERSSIEACQKLCISDAKCVAFTFDNAQQACQLKAEVTSLHLFEGAVSGIKQGAAAPARP